MSIFGNLFPINQPPRVKIEHPHLKGDAVDGPVKGGNIASENKVNFTAESLGFGKDFVPVKTRVEAIEEGFSEVVYINSDSLTFSEYKELKKIGAIRSIYEKNILFLPTDKQLFQQIRRAVERLEKIYDTINKNAKVMNVFKKVVGALAEKDIEELTFEDIRKLERGFEIAKQSLRKEVKLKLALSNPTVHALLISGVLVNAQDENGAARLAITESEDRRAHFEDEPISDIEKAIFDNPFVDSSSDRAALLFQSQYSEKERFEKANKLLDEREFQKPQHEQVQKAKPLRKRSRLETQMAIANSNPFIRDLIENNVLERDLQSRIGFKVCLSEKPRENEKLSHLIDEAFLILDSE